MRKICFVVLVSLWLTTIWAETNFNRRSRHFVRRANEPAPPRNLSPARPNPGNGGGRPSGGVFPTGISQLNAQLLAINERTSYALPDGAELIVGPIKKTFSCFGRGYGYYADVDNNCQIFHICVDYFDFDNGLSATVQHSFLCGNQTIFDQQTLGCKTVDDAFPCKDAPILYDEVNSRFGTID